MSAAELRQAAVLMRSRAEAVLSSSNEWYGQTEMLLNLSGEPESTALEHDATHIASWHPTVALAVADWLDHVSRIADAKQCEPGDMVCALAVARAYLESADD